MGLLTLKLFNVLIIIYIFHADVGNADVKGIKERNTVTRAFKYHELEPDVVSRSPANYILVKYAQHVEVHTGNELTPTQVQDAPYVSWRASSAKYYTLVFVDPDAPSRANPTAAEFLHWLVTNIPGHNINAGTTLTEYIGSNPVEGMHRYVFLVYKQPSLLTFDEPFIDANTRDGRVNFSVMNFAIKYNLGDPIAGNFYQAQAE